MYILKFYVDTMMELTSKTHGFIILKNVTLLVVIFDIFMWVLNLLIRMGWEKIVNVFKNCFILTSIFK